MVRRLQALYYRAKAGWIEAQIDNGIELLNDHQRRLDRCHAELRRVRTAEAMVTPAATLLDQVLRRKS